MAIELFSYTFQMFVKVRITAFVLKKFSIRCIDRLADTFDGNRYVQHTEGKDMIF